MEGPQFSSLAESELYVVGIVMLLEWLICLKPLLEKQMLRFGCNGNDYDRWHATEQNVEVQNIIDVMIKNKKMRKIKRIHYTI